MTLQISQTIYTRLSTINVKRTFSEPQTGRESVVFQRNMYKRRMDQSCTGEKFMVIVLTVLLHTMSEKITVKIRRGTGLKFNSVSWVTNISRVGSKGLTLEQRSPP